MTEQQQGYQPPGYEAPAYQPPVTDPAYQASAAQAVGAVQAPDQGTDSGPTVEEMAEQLAQQKLNAAMSDYEKRLSDMMIAAQAQQAQWSQQFDLMQRQLETVRQQAGPPVAAQLAKSLATRVQAIATANPDLPAQHFAGVISQSQSLADEVEQVAAGKGDANRVEQLAAGVASWFSRVHPRASGKVLEGMHAALDEAERIVEELPKLVPVAAADARVL